MFYQNYLYFCNNVCFNPIIVSKIHSIDFEYDHDYVLIGIHSILADYRMAYFLNETLNIHLHRLKEDLDFASKNCSFPLFTYEDESAFTSWALISNKFVFTEDVGTKTSNLFQEETKIAYLIPEKKMTDYFMKISGLKDDDELSETLTNINKINNIIASYPIDPMDLRSRDNLIF